MLERQTCLAALLTRGEEYAEGLLFKMCYLADMLLSDINRKWVERNFDSCASGNTPTQNIGCMVES